MPMMGLDVPKEEVDKLFDEWDPDKSGVLEIKELHSLFKRRVELDPSLMPGGAGEIELGIDQKYALRKEKVNKDDSTRLQGLNLDENSGVSVAEQADSACPLVLPTLLASTPSRCLVQVIGV